VINYGAAECIAMKKAETFMVAAAEVKKVISSSSEQSGKDYIDQTKTALWLT